MYMACTICIVRTWHVQHKCAVLICFETYLAKQWFYSHEMISASLEISNNLSKVTQRKARAYPDYNWMIQTNTPAGYNGRPYPDVLYV
jgi:hypothetical protein